MEFQPTRSPGSAMANHWPGHRFSRRESLARLACGFGGVALAALLPQWSRAAGASRESGASRKGGAAGDDRPGIAGLPGLPHHPPRAKNVIFLYMDGGPSQVDTFDPKPRLQADDGKPFAMKMEPTQFNNNGNTLGSPWKFRNHGESGLPVSELFQNVAAHADDLCVVRSMTSNFPEHTNANYFLHTGNGFQGRPSMGAWTTYGLGSDCEDLPGFVILNGGLIPPGGLDCFNSGFLPASWQGSIFNSGPLPLANIRPGESSAAIQRRKLDLLGQLDAWQIETAGKSDPVESAIRNHELAWRMQTSVPGVADLADETEETKELYGMNSDYRPEAIYARQCLIARRLVERGVRFIELTCPGTGHDRWDQHANLLKGHTDNARAVDRPIAGLLTDLKRRGLLQETLVVWSGEFGRTPFAQGSDGRDHNPFGFSCWLAGGGIRGGMTFGATDEYGYKAVENRVEIHDLHATMLHLLGVDHERLTWRWSGRDMRLTDVHGRVMKEWLS